MIDAKQAKALEWASKTLKVVYGRVRPGHVEFELEVIDKMLDEYRLQEVMKVDILSNFRDTQASFRVLDLELP